MVSGAPYVCPPVVGQGVLGGGRRGRAGLAAWQDRVGHVPLDLLAVC